MSASLATRLLLAGSLALLLVLLVWDAGRPKARRGRLRESPPPTLDDIEPDQTLQELLEQTRDQVMASLTAPALAGCVFDSLGAPLEGAAIYLEGELQARTDPSGSYRIPIAAPPRLSSPDRYERTLLSLVAVCPGYIPVGQAACPGGGHYSFVLYAGGDVSGFVRDERGAPVANAQVRVRAIPADLSESAPPLKLPAAIVTTSETGQFRARGLPPFTAELKIDAPGYAPLRVLGSFRRQWDLHLPRLVLLRAATVSGHVLDEHGSPIGGAAVECGEARTRTEADGTYTLTGLGTGEQDLQIRIADRIRQTLSVTLGSGETHAALAVVLPPASRLSGHVLLLPGNAPAPAWIAVERIDAEGNVSGQSLSTSMPGQFDLGELSEGTYKLEVNRPDGTPAASASVTLEAGESQDVELYLHDCVVVRGVVLREGDLEPAAGARVRLAHATAPGDALVEEAFTSVSASGEFVIGPFEPGIQELQVEDPAWSLRERVPLSLRAGEVSEQVVVLRAGEPYATRLMHADGVPAKLCPVWAHGRFGWRGTVTDVGGRCTITGLGAAPAELVVRDAAGLFWVVAVDAGARATGEAVRLPARASLEITLQDRNGEVVATPYWLHLRSAHLRDTPVLNGRGPSPLVVDGVPAGSLVIAASLPGHRQPEPTTIEVAPGPNRIVLKLR